MGQIEYSRDENNQPVIIHFDDEFSLQDLSNGPMIDSDLSGKIIYGTLFYHEKPDAVIFRSDMTGVKFYNCNLDNIIIPSGNTLINSKNRRFQCQADGYDWLIDADGNPLERL